MVHTQSIFDRLRSMQTEGLPLHTLIIEACELGDELLAALALIEADCRDVVARGTASQRTMKVYRLAASAIARAYPDNGDTPDNGVRA